MKKLLFILVMVVVAMTTNAQTTVNGSKVFRILPANAGDTLNKDDVDHQYLYIPNFAIAAKFQAVVDSVAGYPKATIIIRSSLDYSNWTNLDTVNLTSASRVGMSSLVLPYAQYLDIQTTAIDSTQTSKFTYTILIEKNP